MEDVSQLVASQYEAYCYPEPVGDLAEPIGRSEFMYGDPSLFSAQLWPEGRPRADLRILIAGCGTNQAAWFAYTNPGCHVTGIDLSGASLAHERFLQEKHGLKNLRLFQGDLSTALAVLDEFIAFSTAYIVTLRIGKCMIFQEDSAKLPRQC